MYEICRLSCCDTQPMFIFVSVLFYTTWIMDEFYANNNNKQRFKICHLRLLFLYSDQSKCSSISMEYHRRNVNRKALNNDFRLNLYTWRYWFEITRLLNCLLDSIQFSFHLFVRNLNDSNIRIQIFSDI